jgi:plasmid maintenance system antidote protein VapI
MSIDKIKQKLIQTSIKDSGWLEKAKWRQENEDWLDISFSIAVRVASTLSANKKADKYPKNQVELAGAMGCSAQYVNKLLKGQEKLQIDTICKVGRILGITLIEVPKMETKQAVQYNNETIITENSNIVSPPTVTSTSYMVINVEITAGENTYALAA